MDKKTDTRTQKSEKERDEADRGVIVAGPDAHANEGAGTTPVNPKSPAKPGRA